MNVNMGSVPRVGPSKVGAVNTGVTAAEFGDYYNHVTKLTISQVDALTIADTAAICDGYLLYTFPAGEIIIDAAWMSMGCLAADATYKADTPDVGLGTVIGTGAVATLDGTATFENIITGQTAADCNNTATVHAATPTTNGLPFVMQAADAHTLHFNIADTWGNGGADLTVDIAGTVIIFWKFLG